MWRIILLLQLCCLANYPCLMPVNLSILHFEVHSRKVRTRDKEMKLCGCFFLRHAHSPVHLIRFSSSGNTYWTAICSDAACVALSYNWLSVSTVKVLTCLSSSPFDWINTSFCVFICFLRYCLILLFFNCGVILSYLSFIDLKLPFWFFFQLLSLSRLSVVLTWLQLCCSVCCMSLTHYFSRPVFKAHISIFPFTPPSSFHFPFYRCQQWPTLRHIQINTSPTADVFNMTPSVSALGFTSVAFSMCCTRQRVSLPLSLSLSLLITSLILLDSHHIPSTSILDPNDQKKKKKGWLDLRTD